ncbi:MAG: CBS domain-containing protein [Pirellulales bacterium]|jgi:CBS domain-containing protein
MLCANCGAENIEGVDQCEACGQSMQRDRSHLSAIEKSMLKDRISDLEPREVLTVAPDATVKDVLNLLVDNRVGSVVITEAGMPVGIFSERDVLVKLGNSPEEFEDKPISDFMTTNPQTLESSAKIAFAVHQMDMGHYRHLPIVDQSGIVTGIISVRDILRYLKEKVAS